MLKPMLQPTWQPVWQDTFRPMFGKVAQLVRNILYVEKSAGGHVEFAEPIIIPKGVEFCIKGEFYLDIAIPTSNNQFIFGGLGGSGTKGNFTLFVDKNTGLASLQLPKADATTTYHGVASEAVVGKWVKYKVQRVGATITLTINGVPSAGITNVWDDFEISHLCRWSGVSRFTGYQTLFSLEVGGVLTHSLDLDISKGSSVVPNLARPVSNELVRNGAFDDAADWVLGTGWTITNGRAELVSDGTAATLRQNNILEIGKEYLISFDVESDMADIGFQNESGQIVAGGRSGRVTAVWVADSISLMFKRAGGSPTGWVDNVSVVEVQGYARTVNVPEESNQTYTWFDKYQGWVSEELAAYSTVEIPRLASSFNYHPTHVVSNARAGYWLITATMSYWSTPAPHVGWSTSLSGVSGDIRDGFRTDHPPPQVLGGLVASSSGGDMRLYSSNNEMHYTGISAKYIIKDR